MRDYVFYYPYTKSIYQSRFNTDAPHTAFKKRINSLLISVLFSVKLRPFAQLTIKHQTHQSPHCGNLDFLQLKNINCSVIIC